MHGSFTEQGTIVRIEPAVKLKLASSSSRHVADTLVNDQREFTTPQQSLGILETRS